MIVSGLLILLIIIGAAFVVLMLFNVKLGLFVFFVTLPFQNIFFYTRFMYISLSDIFAGLLFFSWLILLLLRRVEFPKRKVLYFILAIWVLALIGCFTSIDPRTSLRFALRLLSYFAVFVVLLSVMNSMSIIRLVLYAMAIQLLVISVVTNWKYLTSKSVIEETIDVDPELEQSPVRSSGIARDMNTTAYNLTVLMPLTLGIALVDKRKALIPVLALSLSALLITMSRGGWVAWSASLFFLPRLKLKHVIVLILVFAVVFSVFYQLFFERIEATRLESDSIAVRILMYDFSWYLFKQHPVLGIGGGNFSPNAYNEFPYLRERITLSKGYCSTHNQYLGILVENGIAAFMVYVLFLVYIAKNIMTRRTAQTGQVEILRKTVLAAFVVLLVMQMFAYFGLRNYLYWSVIALIFAVQDVAAREQEREKLLAVQHLAEDEKTTLVQPDETAGRTDDKNDDDLNILGIDREEKKDE